MLLLGFAGVGFMAYRRKSKPDRKKIIWEGTTRERASMRFDMRGGFATGLLAAGY